MSDLGFKRVESILNKHTGHFDKIEDCSKEQLIECIQELAKLNQSKTMCLSDRERRALSYGLLMCPNLQEKGE